MKQIQNVPGLALFAYVLLYIGVYKTGAGVIQPNPLNCSAYFPGTPGWNQCFQKWNAEMARFSTQVHDYAVNQAKEANKENGSFNRINSIQSSSSSYKSDSTFTSNAFVSGYSIRAINVPFTTLTNNGMVKMTFQSGPLNKFAKAVNGNKLEYSLASSGEQKVITISVPSGVSVKDLKIDQVGDKVQISGPAMTSGSTMNVVQGGNTVTFNTGGAFNPNFKPPTVPDYHSIMQNVFQNMFKGGFPNFG